ncbi:hypothetical protein [Microbacterium sp. ZOR0019]|uniref:hypothetical protein n=1 Tax=Microbacterium sp. ZOR0019 TaxID=1339233 RepID=UPI0006479F72|nr:hypothetical protein [Microbacterium sp. ZOR0019]
MNNHESRPGSAFGLGRAVACIATVAALTLGAAVLPAAANATTEAPPQSDAGTPETSTPAPDSGVAPVTETPDSATPPTAAPEAVAKALGGISLFFAAQGPGYGTWDDRVGWQGGFLAPDGSIVYCIEPGTPNPSGTSTDGGWQDGVVVRTPIGNRTLTANDQARIGRIVSEFGQTWDNREASAVSFAVKAVAYADAMYASHSYTGAHTLPGYVNWVLYSQVGSAEARAIADRAQAILDATAGTTAGPILGAGSVDFDVDPVNNYNGTVTVSSAGAPAGAAVTITLTNGIFEATGTPSLAGAKVGTAYKVRGVAPDDGSDWKISGSASINSGWGGSLHVWNTGDKQKTAGPGRSASWTANGEDPLLRAPDFQPQATSLAPRFAKPGDALSDTATFQIAADENGRINEWFRNSKGEYAPTDWTVKAYKVAKAPEKPTDELPADAELIAETTVSTGTEGPGAKRTATFGDAVMPADGSPVVYVWEFDASAQGTRTPLFPEGYLWTDLFGLYEETTFGVDVTTKAQVGTKKGSTSYDTAIVTGVLPNEGLELTFEKYVIPTKQDETGKWVPDAPEGTEPGDLTWVCENPAVEPTAARAGSGNSNLVADNLDEPIHITTAGEYKSPEFPADQYGTELWVEQLATVPDENGNQEIVDRGECGEPTETTHVVDVKTQAFSDSGAGTSKRGDQLWDTAEVMGSVPEGATVTFRAYQVPTGSELICTEKTLVWTSQPVALAAGLYKSDPQKVDSGKFTPAQKPVGMTTTFVETTNTEDGGQLSTGECGEPSETLTTPAAPNLAQTGGDGLNMPLLAGAGGLLLGGLALTLTRLIRRRATAAVTETAAE